MTLIIILIAMAVEHYVGVVDEFRRFDWFTQYTHWLENKLGQYRGWNSTGGVIITLTGPLFLIWLLDLLLFQFFFPLSWLLALFILLYCLGPKYLDPLLDEYINALEEGAFAKANELESELLKDDRQAQADDQHMIESILVEANKRLFAVIFWFTILGPFGALLYRCTEQLRLGQMDIHGNFSDAARDLYDILNWPTARLLALANALSGNLVDAIEAWRETERDSLQVNEVVIKATGLGALQYSPRTPLGDESEQSETCYWMGALRGLLNRTLVIWLTVLGLITLAGWIG